VTTFNFGRFSKVIHSDQDVPLHIEDAHVLGLDLPVERYSYRDALRIQRPERLGYKPRQANLASYASRRLSG